MWLELRSTLLNYIRLKQENNSIRKQLDEKDLEINNLCDTVESYVTKLYQRDD